MMRCKAVFVAVAMAMAFSAFAADPTISVEARQRYPWNGLVDLKFVVTGTSGTKYDTSFTAKDMIGGTNITMATVRKSNGVAANVAKEQLTPGTYNWVWDAAADLPKDFKCNEMTITGTANASPFPYSVKFNANGGTGTMSNESFTYGMAKALTANAFTKNGYTFEGWATSANGAKAYSDKQSVINLATSSGQVVNLYAVWKAALYMVVDLSSGANANSYPISYLDAVPNGGWSDTYKTTKLVLRRIEPGTFKMNGSFNVTLTKCFYIGIFECTQKQYESIAGDHVGQYSKSTWPAEYISYTTLRGSTEGAKWPTSSKVDAASFFGKFRSRTKLDFDLPTEAQWEYACRAGTTSKYNNGGDAESDLAIVGRYIGNRFDDKGYSGSATTIPNYTNVGSYSPNKWGLYDMHGNVWEWVLDCYGNLSSGSDPKGATTGKRVVRGGSWGRAANQCTSSFRNSMHAYYEFSDDGSYGSNDGNGFRICLTLQ